MAISFALLWCLCMNVSICVLCNCLPALWLLRAPNFARLFRQTVGLEALFSLSVLLRTALCCEGSFPDLPPTWCSHCENREASGQYYYFFKFQWCTAVYLVRGENCFNVCFLSSHCRHHTLLYQAHCLKIQHWQMYKAVSKELNTPLHAVLGKWTTMGWNDTVSKWIILL